MPPSTPSQGYSLHWAPVLAPNNRWPTHAFAGNLLPHAFTVRPHSQASRTQPARPIASPPRGHAPRPAIRAPSLLGIIGPAALGVAGHEAQPLLADGRARAGGVRLPHALPAELQRGGRGGCALVLQRRLRGRGSSLVNGVGEVQPCAARGAWVRAPSFQVSRSIAICTRSFAVRLCVVSGSGAALGSVSTGPCLGHGQAPGRGRI